MQLGPRDCQNRGFPRSPGRARQEKWQRGKRAAGQREPAAASCRARGPEPAGPAPRRRTERDDRCAEGNSRSPAPGPRGDARGQDRAPARAGRAHALRTANAAPKRDRAGRTATGGGPRGERPVARRAPESIGRNRKRSRPPRRGPDVGESAQVESRRSSAGTGGQASFATSCRRAREFPVSPCSSGRAAGPRRHGKRRDFTRGASGGRRGSARASLTLRALGSGRSTKRGPAAAHRQALRGVWRHDPSNLPKPRGPRPLRVSFAGLLRLARGWRFELRRQPARRRGVIRGRRCARWRNIPWRRRRHPAAKLPPRRGWIPHEGLPASDRRASAEFARKSDQEAAHRLRPARR